MRNTYRVKGNKVYITIPAANGRIPLPETEVAIDIKNLEKAQVYPGNWVQAIHQKTGEIYIRGSYSKNGKRDQPVLARYIADPGDRENTRHLDGDPLNCLECNLINAPIGIQDIQGLTPISPPPVPEPKPEPQELLKPVKGVSWHKSKRRWEVKPYYQGKRQCIGYWLEWQLSEANEAAEYVREYGPEAYKAKIEGGK